MVYGLPTDGEPNWGAKVNASIEAVKTTADAAETEIAGRLSEANLTASYVGRAASGVVRESDGKVLWDAELNTRGDLSAYNVQYPEFATVEDDPALGTARKVVHIDVPDTGEPYPAQPWPDDKPRCQVESPYIIGEHDDVYIGYSQYLPADFPVIPADEADGWLNLGEVHGPPFGGASGNGATPILDQYVWHFAEIDLPVERDKWVDFVIRCRMSDSPYGFFEMWTCSGAAWQQRTFTMDAAHGGGPPTYQRRKSVYQPEINDGGPNMHKKSIYRSLGTWPRVHAYFADHRIGTTWESVKPNSYPSATLPWTDLPDYVE